MDPTVFRPLPPVPSASPLQLPYLPRSTSNVFEGPQWIPAFHHPNSPYVPWSSPVRQRILPPPSPPPVSSPCVRLGAVAPEPWASSTHGQSTTKRLANSWKNFKSSVNHGAKAVLFHLGKTATSLGTPCASQDMLHIYHDTVQPPKARDSASRDSFASSDSAMLQAWLAKRRTAATCAVKDTPKEMSVEEYEVMGSWLDGRLCDAGWTCGIQDCDMHTANGSPCAAHEYPVGLRTTTPLDCTELPSMTYASPAHPFPPGPRRFYSLPRLPVDRCK